VSAPLVSVVVPAFNPGPQIVETIESVLAQTWPRVETIVVDDGSSDGTEERLAPYRGRVRYLRQENAGGGAARNAGLRATRGEQVVFLDHDDLLEPEALERQVEVLRRHPRSGFVAGDGVETDAPGARALPLLRGPLATQRSVHGGTWTGDGYAALLQANAIATPAQVLVPRAVLELVGPLSERRDEASDYDLWLRIARERPVTLHDAPLVRWRYRPTSRSGPAALRPLRWALMDLPVLERQLADASSLPRRREVRRALRRRARLARLAWLVGRCEGMPEARRLLRRLSGAAPWMPRPRLWWLATWLPARWVEGWAKRGSRPEELAELGPRADAHGAEA
jgi:glycosyltransferase involved in cell wall biosynthesis